MLPDGGAKVCAGGTSCDPEDGQCKCGGLGGLTCAGAVPDGGAAAQVCVLTPFSRACRPPCDVRQLNCGANEFCFYDSSATTPVSYCSPPPPSSVAKAERDSCNGPTECYEANPARSMHCNGLAVGITGICRVYCDVAAGTTGCRQTPRPQTCLPILGATGAFMGYGYCQEM